MALQFQDFDDERIPFLWVTESGDLVCVDRAEGYIFLCDGLMSIEYDIFWSCNHIATLSYIVIDKHFPI